MSSTSRSLSDQLIILCCIVFIAILLLSGYFERDVLVLHLFQSLIYVAIIAFSMKRSIWGYAIGISIAAFWDYYNIRSGFVFRAGWKEWGNFLRTANVKNPVFLMAPVAWLDHLLLIFASLRSYGRLPGKRASDLLIFAAGFVVVIGYFVGIVALFAPRYLAGIKRMLLG